MDIALDSSDGRATDYISTIPGVFNQSQRWKILYKTTLETRSFSIAIKLRHHIEKIGENHLEAATGTGSPAKVWRNHRRPGEKGIHRKDACRERTTIAGPLHTSPPR